MATQFDPAGRTPGFRGVGAPRADDFRSCRSGTNILSGFGVFDRRRKSTGGGRIWRAGAGVADRRCAVPGRPWQRRNDNNNRTADADLRKRWDGQYPSLWVTQGGGGTFANIWTPEHLRAGGILRLRHQTPGHVYRLSNEHHVRTEIKLDHVENWDFNAPQTEEEAGESPDALSLEIGSSKNITIANYHAYRVTRSRAPFPAAVRIYNSADIHFRNVHVNAESGVSDLQSERLRTFLRLSKFPFENSIQDMTHHLDVREREFAVLDIPANANCARRRDASAVLAPGAKVRKLEEGFFSISGAAVDASGKLYFVDHHQHRIYGWSASEGSPSSDDIRWIR